MVGAVCARARVCRSGGLCSSANFENETLLCVVVKAWARYQQPRCSARSHSCADPRRTRSAARRTTDRFPWDGSHALRGRLGCWGRAPPREPWVLEACCHWLRLRRLARKGPHGYMYTNDTHSGGYQIAGQGADGEFFRRQQRRQLRHSHLLRSKRCLPNPTHLHHRWQLW